MYYARARYYNPDTGRFTTPDPIQDPAKRYSPAGLSVYIWAFNNPLSFYDPFGLWSIGFGIVISWDPTHGFGIGVGAAFDFSKEIGIGVNASIVNYADNSTTYSLGAQLAISTIVLSAKVGLGMSYNTKSGTNFYANAGFSVADLGVMAGTSQNWDASGNYIGGTTNVKGFVGDIFSNVGVGFQVGSGAYQGQTGMYMEAESYGNSARMSFNQNGSEFSASAAGFSMAWDKNGPRLTGFNGQLIGYQVGEQMSEYKKTYLNRFTGFMANFINAPRYDSMTMDNYVPGDENDFSFWLAGFGKLFNKMNRFKQQYTAADFMANVIAFYNCGPAFSLGLMSTDEDMPENWINSGGKIPERDDPDGTKSLELKAKLDEAARIFNKDLSKNKELSEEDIQKINKIAEEIEPLVLYQGQVRGATLGDEGGLGHDIRGALYSYLASSYAKNTGIVELRNDNKYYYKNDKNDQLNDLMKAYSKAISVSDGILVEVNQRSLSPNMEIIGYDSNDARYNYFCYTYHWQDQAMAQFYTRSLIGAFTAMKFFGENNMPITISKDALLNNINTFYTK